MHPQQVAAQVRQELRQDRVLTQTQLERRGYGDVLDWIGLPTTVRSCRTQITQRQSEADLIFWALSEDQLSRPSPELMHLAGLAEARQLFPLREGEVWRLTDVRGRAKTSAPDAEVVQPLDPLHRSDWFVEFDAGYPIKRIADKLLAAQAGGYEGVYWATSIQGRVRAVTEFALKLEAKGRLTNLPFLITRYVNFWTAEQPYTLSPRSHKLIEQRTRFSEAAGRSLR